MAPVSVSLALEQGGREEEADFSQSAQILDMQRRQELWLLSREALDCGAGCRDPGTKAKHLLCASGSG